MLAGILFGLCLAPIKALIEVPLPATLVILAWLSSRAGSAIYRDAGRGDRRRRS